MLNINAKESLLTKGVSIRTMPTRLTMSKEYRQVSNKSRTLVGNKFVDHSDVVGTSAGGAAPTTSSFST